MLEDHIWPLHVYNMNDIMKVVIKLNQQQMTAYGMLYLASLDTFLNQLLKNCIYIYIY